MGILLWIILGALAGCLAGKIMGTEKRGFIANVLIGVLGANIGGFVAAQFGLGGVNGFNLYSLLIAIGGACLLLMIVRLFRGKA